MIGIALVLYCLGSSASLSALNAAPLSPVEQVFITESGRSPWYPAEKLPVVEVNNSFKLGKLVALRFLEWVIDNPEGVISLPTGKTPEYFIKYLEYYKKNWVQPAVQKELQRHGIRAVQFPDASRLKFVQMDEFFKIKASQKNSFNYYIKKYYLPILELKEENILLLDRKDMYATYGKNVDNYCDAYEKQIQAWGGIGFFLGGIGPDGHLAFNMRGSEHTSLTRLITLNYESAAAAATDLGGIEYSRNKKAITIGLHTITARPDAVIIIMAAGEAKAPIIAQSLESDNQQLPATALHRHAGARFYLTTGAASLLSERKKEAYQALPLEHHAPWDEAVYEIAWKAHKKLSELTRADFEQSAYGTIMLQKLACPLEQCVAQVEQRLITKLENSLALPEGISVLHTEPHHDDIMLSYHPVATKLIGRNDNFFVTLTSGFNAVTKGYVKNLLAHADESFVQMNERDIFVTSYAGLLHQYKSALLANDRYEAEKIEYLIFLHYLRSIFSLDTSAALLTKLRWLQEDYLPKTRPGEKDIPEIQLLKGAMRESEIDRLWTLYDVPRDHVSHLRSTFYTGDYFSPNPTINQDVIPIVELMKKTKPDLITVAFDPEGTGPDTHYKVLQLVAEALRIEKERNPMIWGYRNVWHRFKVSDATLLIPVSEHDLEQLHTDFMNCFSTQKSASFPAHQFDGPFSGLSCAIVREQLGMLQQLLGESYFATHPNEKVRTAQGMLFLKQMTTEEFLSQATELKARIDFA